MVPSAHCPHLPIWRAISFQGSPCQSESCLGLRLLPPTPTQRVGIHPPFSSGICRKLLRCSPIEWGGSDHDDDEVDPGSFPRLETIGCSVCCDDLLPNMPQMLSCISWQTAAGWAEWEGGASSRDPSPRLLTRQVGAAISRYCLQSEGLPCQCRRPDLMRYSVLLPPSLARSLSALPNLVWAPPTLPPNKESSAACPRLIRWGSPSVCCWSHKIPLTSAHIPNTPRDNPTRHTPLPSSRRCLALFAMPHVCKSIAQGCCYL